MTFAAGKHAPVRQVIKETNLFFALPGAAGPVPGLAGCGAPASLGRDLPGEPGDG